MNSSHWQSHPLRRLLLAQFFALTAVSAALAQAVSSPDAATLAKYDTNKNGRLDPSEIAAMQADQAKVPVQNASKQKDDVVELSPFEVDAGSQKGYYASNTMAGTRLNSKIEDLASAVSVVTKQEMSDFAMLDINDIFAYETSTEGTGNYTDFAIDRNGMVADNIQNNPQGANRVRGGSAANISMDNFATSGRVPIDPINIDAVEISRGPNSSIFGLGQGSGTVNTITASANLSRETSTVETRVDSTGGYRASLDLNRPLLRDKLAIRANTVYQHDAYRLKPAGAVERRYNFMVRAQPFKNTSIKASYQVYDFFGTRPNSLTPRDAVSYWEASGRPTWDPIATAVTVNGVTTVAGSTTPLSLSLSSFNARPALFVEPTGQITLWEIQQMPAATATNGANNVGGTQRLLETAADPVRTNHPLYSTVRGVTNKNIYDWTKYNLSAANSAMDHNEMTTVQFEQTFFRTDRQLLATQLAWQREDAERLTKNFVGQAQATGNSGYLYIDVNEKLLDGRPNPNFLRPFMGVGEPTHRSQPYLRDTIRGQLAYSMDFTKPESKLGKWFSWLGKQQVVGYAEERLTKQLQYSFRDVNITDNPIYAPAGQPKGNQSGVVAPGATRTYVHFYVGDNNGQNVDYGPKEYHYGTYGFNWYNPQTNAWVVDNNQLSEGAIQEGSGGNAASQNMIKTRGIMLQSTMIDDRIVFTGGRRHDDNYVRFARNAVLLPNGYSFDYNAMNGWVSDTSAIGLSDGDGLWNYRQGDTNQKGVVLKPFRGWPALDRVANSGGAAGFFAGMLTGLNINYNKSDSFLPEVPAVSVNLEQLPNPTSEGKDYGFSLSFWNNKVVLRANRWVNKSINTRAGQFGTFGQRVLRLDFENFAGNNDNFSLQKQARLWVAAANPAFTPAQVDTAVFALMGVTPEQAFALNNSTIGETQDQTGKGDELEINFNPDNFWTFKMNVSKTESIDANVAPHIPGWIVQRQPVWNSIIDPRSGTPWFTTLYNATGPVTTGGSNAANFLQGNVVSGVQLGQATQGKSRPEIRKWHINLASSVRLGKYFENRYLKNVTVGGGIRYESKIGIGYYGIPVGGDIAAATAFDANRPVYDKANTYVDAFVSYNMRMFHDKVRARFQLNGRNLQDSNTRLAPVSAYADGSPNTFRIVDPRTFVLTASFDL
jgi:hypothetical protein